MLTTNCGTPVYMAPEIWKGVEYNQKVDMWSVGVVMYYLLSGTHPFDGDGEDLGKDIINAELTFPDDVWRPVSSKGIFVSYPHSYQPYSSALKERPHLTPGRQRHRGPHLALSRLTHPQTSLRTRTSQPLQNYPQG